MINELTFYFKKVTAHVSLCQRCFAKRKIKLISELTYQMISNFLSQVFTVYILRKPATRTQTNKQSIISFHEMIRGEYLGSS